MSSFIEKVRNDAIAWFFAHQNMTVAEALAYLVAAHRTHAPVIIGAWRESGLSLVFLAGVAAHFANPQTGKAA
jgi:hypothetical protein